LIIQQADTEKNKNSRIREGMLVFICIPIVSFILPVVFFGTRFQKAPFFTWQMFITTMVITTAIWIGNRAIMLRARSMYPHFDDSRKRLYFQSLVMLLYTLIINNLIGYLMKDFSNITPGRDGKSSFVDLLINCNSAAIFTSITIVAIYESRYFMDQLGLSVQEKEMLKRESLLAQLHTLKTHVNPHFLFNNLNTLCSIIPENPRQAVDFVQQLSKVYRYILEVKDEKSISLRDEIKVLEAYTFLMKTRFGNNFNIEVLIPEQDMDNQIVPYSLQLLVENAIKHNIVSADKPLWIKVYTVNGELLVTNNLQKKKQEGESTGIGLSNIRNRYMLLTNKLVAVTETEFSFSVSIPLIPS
jgi:sensor histidine kinase YesM